MTCWLSTLPGAGPCDGRLVKVHLIPRSLMRRELAGRDVVLKDLLWDPRTWVWGCGGIVGLGGHHGALDVTRRLRIPRGRLPRGTEEFAVEFGLGWWLDRTYGAL